MKKDIEELELRFLETQKQHTKSNWDNAKFLINLAERTKASDLGLAYRLAQRAKSLEPDNKEVLVSYKALSEDVQAKMPGVFTMTSTEKTNKANMSRLIKNSPVAAKATGLLEQIKARLKQSPIIGFVLIPWFIFAVYQTLIATERYESVARIIVKQPDTVAAPVAEMSFLAGLSGNSDGALVQAYVYSADLIEYLILNTKVEEHYTDTDVDYFSRLAKDHEKEDFYEFYQEHVKVEMDAASQIIDIAVQGFDPEFAKSLNEKIVERTEWYINSISQKLAEQQLVFINSEHQRISDKFAGARKELLDFQARYNLLSPDAEGAAMQNITYGLENQIVNKETELLALLRVMSEDSVEVQRVRNQLQALREQLESERRKLSTSDNLNDMPVSQIMAKFQELKVNVEIALQSFTSSLMLIEKARVEVYQQVKYLVTVQKPITPQKTSYPKAWYNILLFGFVALIAYGICRIVIATIKELS